MQHKTFAVITTVQPPTASVRALAAKLGEGVGRLVVAGDKKGPEAFDVPGAQFLSLQEQLEAPFALARKLPTGHYARKNIGYLTAMAQGASCIYETDDDNAPGPRWDMKAEWLKGVCAAGDGRWKVEDGKVSGSRWVNVYRLFTKERVWPRGFPLDEVAQSFTEPVPVSNGANQVRAPIQQLLSNNSADVDAIWRLVFDRSFDFDDGLSVWLPPRAWCPFNSQSTWWFPIAYPLMYLPSYCTFRMTDIWRSFVAQRCLWELELGLVFHGPEVIQERNEHHLMRDFDDEIPGYQRNGELVEVLEGLTLAQGADAIDDNVRRCYEALVAREFYPQKELELLAAWRKDLEMAKAETPKTEESAL